MRLVSKLTLVVVMVMFGSGLVMGADTTVIAPNPKFSVVDSNGDPYVGAKLYTYDTGTTTLKTTWKDHNKIAENTNPIILDSSGQADVWIDSLTGAYRFKLKDPDDVTLWTQDNIKAVDGVALSDDSVTEAALKCVNDPTDEDILTYESTTGDYQWQGVSWIISDVAYAASWNAVTDVAPSKNVVYDKMELMLTDIDANTTLINTPHTGDVTGATALTIAVGVVAGDELASTAVTPGDYTAANITVDADGRITAATDGSGGVTSIQDLTLTNDTITVTGTDGIRYVRVDTEAAAASDSLCTVYGGAVGDIVIITTLSSARTVTVLNDTGAPALIHLRDNVNFTLSHPDDSIILLCVVGGASPCWIEISHVNAS